MKNTEGHKRHHGEAEGEDRKADVTPEKKGSDQMMGRMKSQVIVLVTCAVSSLAVRYSVHVFIRVHIL